MKTAKIKDLKNGDFFVKKSAKVYENGSVNESSVWVRGDYDRTTKTYSCYKFDDICHEMFLKGSTDVVIDLYF